MENVVPNNNDERRHDYPSILARLDAMDLRLDKWQNEMRLMLNGSPDGDETKPGLLVRLDRIERELESFKRVFARVWAVIGTVVGAVLLKWFNVIEHVWDKLTNQ